MPLHGINDNILIPHLFYSGVYQYEAKKRNLYKDKNIVLGLKQTKKTDKTVVKFSLSTLSKIK